MTKTTKSSTAAPKATATKSPKAANPKAPESAKAKATPQTTPVAASQPKPVIVTETSPSVVDPALKKKELIDLVVESSGIKKKDAKPVIESMLEVLGKALSDGRELNLQPLGKVKINRAKEVQGGKVLITKIRQSNRVKTADDADASTGSDD